MKTHLVAALLAAAAMIPGMATAQDGQQRGERRAQAERGGDRQAQRQPRGDDQRAERGDRQQPQQQVQRRDRDGDRPEVRRDRDGTGNGNAVVHRGDPRYDGRQDVRRDDRNRGWQQGGYDNRQRFSPQRYGNTTQRWSGNWRQDRRYDWNRYRSYNRSAFRLPRYYAPSGWRYGYRPFRAGIRISSALFGQNYWISDPWDYRLPPAYGPYRWVRYYNDAVLVDIRSGYVVDVINGIFW